MTRPKRLPSENLMLVAERMAEPCKFQLGGGYRDVGCVLHHLAKVLKLREWSSINSKYAEVNYLAQAIANSGYENFSRRLRGFSYKEEPAFYVYSYNDGADVRTGSDDFDYPAHRAKLHQRMLDRVHDAARLAKEAGE